jgi:hypothetical protein
MDDSKSCPIPSPVGRSELSVPIGFQIQLSEPIGDKIRISIQALKRANQTLTNSPLSFPKPAQMAPFSFLRICGQQRVRHGSV